MLTPTASTMLRSSVVRASNNIQPMLFRSAAICPYSTITPMSTASTPSVRSSRPTGPTTNSSQSLLVVPKPSVSSTIFFHIRAAPCRHASTSAPSATKPQASRLSDAERDASAAQRAADKHAAAHAEAAALDWNSFFKLRKTRRRWQLGFSILATVVSASTGAVVLAQGLAEPLVDMLPLDPFVSLGLLTMACAAVGWLAGPSLGTGVFYLLQRHRWSQFVTKEDQFFARIKKHRVDPANSSARNPVPDFYGERISSVAGYRQWLKDQRAFNKKRTTFV